MDDRRVIRGIMITQNGAPFLQPGELQNAMRAFRGLFADASCYLASIPTYTGGPMAMGWATDGDARETPLDVLEGRFAAAGIETRCRAPGVHKAAFALPGYVAKLVR